MKKLLTVELLKLKHSKIIWIVILAPMFIVLQGVTNFMRYHDLFTQNGQNIWYKIFEQSIIFYCILLLPLLITLVITLMTRIENINNGWKYYLALPVPRSQVYLAKLIIGSGLILINIFFFSLSMYLGGKLVGAEKTVPYSLIFIKPLLAYIASFPIISILYLISVKFSKEAIILAVGIVGSIPAILAANTKVWFLYPFSYPIIASLSDKFNESSLGLWLYPLILSIFIIFLIGGIRNFNKKDII